MAQATGFQHDLATGNIKMNAGDTGAIKVKCTRESGESWPAESRMLMTVRKSDGTIVMQRIYRLDDQYGLGDGTVLIEFHNDDTDDWESGDYSMERRYDVHPVWEGTPSTARCVDALTSDARMIEGATVRTVFAGVLHIDGVLGRI